MASAGELCSVCYAGTLQLLQGYLVCEICGMQSQEFVETQEELPEGQAPNTARRIKQRSTRGTIERETVPVASLTGATCTQLVMGYALLWQQMLKKQVAVLQSLLGMGPELPEVAQQLWTATVKLSSLLEDETIRQLGGAPGNEERPEMVNIHNVIKSHLPPASTLQICFLAAWILRAPLLPRDIVTMVVAGTLPFLDVAHHAEGVELHPRDIDGYRPSGVPGANFLAQQACQLANALGLKLPSANVPALARRFLQDLKLPEELADVMQLLSDLYLLPNNRLDLGEAPGRDDADRLFAQAHCKYLDSRENPLRNPFINVLAVLVIAVRLVWGLEGDQRTVNHLLLGHSPRFPQEFPPCPHWQAWAHEMVLNQLMPYMAPEQAAKADDAALAAWMKRVQGTTLARSSEPPDSLQIATDLLEPQAQAFWQRSGQLAGHGQSPTALPLCAPSIAIEPADAQLGSPHCQNGSKAQQVKKYPPGTYRLSGIAATEQAKYGHPDYVSCLTAASAYLGCLPRHLHYSVCCIEQEMADVERALGTGQRP